MRVATGTLVVPGREEWHRRALLLATAALLLLSTGPVFGHHVSDIGSSTMNGIDHLGAVCVAALQVLLSPVHGAFHVLIVAGLVYAAGDRIRSAQRVRAVLQAIPTRCCAVGDAFWRAARVGGVDPASVRVVPFLPIPAFTAGWWRPRIYVSDSLASALDGQQLAAVLAHEHAHVRRRDPLRRSVLRFLACSLFWIPALRRLSDDMDDEAEILADDAAARLGPLALASALLALARWKTRDAEAFVGFHREDLLPRRIHRLAGERIAPRSRVTRRSIAAAAVALALVWSSGVAAALPASTPDVDDHCRHHTNLFAHLFCARPMLALDPDCRHAP